MLSAERKSVSYKHLCFIFSADIAEGVTDFLHPWEELSFFHVLHLPIRMWNHLSNTWSEIFIPEVHMESVNISQYRNNAVLFDMKQVLHRRRKRYPYLEAIDRTLVYVALCSINRSGLDIHVWLKSINTRLSGITMDAWKD